MSAVAHFSPLAALLRRPAQKKVDCLVQHLKTLPQASVPLKHTFTPGLYVREMFVPKGVLFVSKIHKSEHPFVIAKGKVKVWTEGTGVIEIQAPYFGITTPGTRRVVYVHEDCSWMTFHPTDKKTPEEVEADIIYNPEKESIIEAEVIEQLKSV